MLALLENLCLTYDVSVMRRKTILYDTYPFAGRTEE